MIANVLLIVIQLATNAEGPKANVNDLVPTTIPVVAAYLLEYVSTPFEPEHDHPY